MSDTETRWTARELADRIAGLADEKQAGKITLLHVGPELQVTDWFVICTGQNRRHLNVLAEHVARELKHVGLHRMGGSTGLRDQNWVLLDYGAVVLHVFSEEGRAFYDLENLWSDCDREEFVSPVPPPATDA